MREDDLSRVLLVQACEQSDPEGLYVSFGVRRTASEEAVRSTGSAEHLTSEPTASAFSSLPTSESEELIARRAAPIAARLVEAHPAFQRARSLASLSVPAVLVLGVGLVLGIGLDSLGSLRRINLLSFPLLGLLIWNVVAYGALLLRSFGAAKFRMPSALVGIAERFARAGGGGGPSPLAAAKSEARDSRDQIPRQGVLTDALAASSAWQAESLGRFFSLWRESCGDLLEARVAGWLHTAAAGVAAGSILSMYFAGFAFEYRATWESTFLDAVAAHAFLSVLLAPAAAILGVALPSAAVVAALETPGDGEAAVWIHLWSVTTALVVLLPRTALAILSAVAEARALRGLAFDLDTHYARSTLAPDRGLDSSVEVQPYSYRPSSRSQELLRELLLELFGNHSRVEFCEPLAYGVDLPSSSLPTGGERCRVLVFNLAQSPEQEVHGALLNELKEWVGEGEGRDQVLVILDEEPYARRIAAGNGAQRLDQRRRAWERVVRLCELSVCELPGDGLARDTLEKAAGHIWPGASTGGNA